MNESKFKLNCVKEINFEKLKTFGIFCNSSATKIVLKNTYKFFFCFILVVIATLATCLFL